MGGNSGRPLCLPDGPNGGEKLPYVTSSRLTHRQGERGAGWIANDTGDFER